MEKRIGTVSMFINNRENINTVNDILHDFADIIVSRMGVPYKEKRIAVIVLIVDGTTDEIGAMTGKLGNIKGVSVKSAFSKN